MAACVSEAIIGFRVTWMYPTFFTYIVGKSNTLQKLAPDFFNRSLLLVHNLALTDCFWRHMLFAWILALSWWKNYFFFTTCGCFFFKSSLIRFNALAKYSTLIIVSFLKVIDEDYILLADKPNLILFGTDFLSKILSFDHCFVFVVLWLSVFCPWLINCWKLLPDSGWTTPSNLLHSNVCEQARHPF